MKKINWLLLLCLFGCSKPIQENPHSLVTDTAHVEFANTEIKTIKKTMERVDEIGKKANLSLRAIFYIAELNLKRNGYHDLADEIKNEWGERDGKIYEIAKRIEENDLRGIGDFKPLSEWLQKAYEKIEEKLGYQLCLALRLSDIKTINHGLYVLFNLCDFELKDFYEHFVNDGRYRGLLPVISYWSTIMACSIGTYGIGYFFICSPIGMLVELGVDKKVAPYLAPKIHNFFCD